MLTRSALHVQRLPSLPASCLWRIEQARYQWELRRSTWEVSSLGRVKNLRGITHHGTLTCFGYKRARIGGKSYMVHRLVARAFLGPPPFAAYTQINHIDGDPHNNAANNLEYATPSQNRQHWLQTAVDRTSGGPTRPLYCRSSAGAWSYFESLTEAAHALGLAGSNISKCCQGRLKHVGGYECQYAESAFLPGEEWRIAQYPGVIQAISNWMVSSHGRVKTSRGRITHGTLTKAGYFAMYTVSLTRYGLSSRPLVHRLVAASFLGQPTAADLQVNHLDGNRGNNHVWNLEYATPAQNAQHASTLRAGCRVQRPNARKPVLARENGGLWIHFESCKAAAAYAGVHAASVSQICHGKFRRTKNWEFKFAASDALPSEEWRQVVLDWSCDPEPVLQ
ncbi:unnamed protein product [Effrenium voratum]|uniref:HNH nuclease domain-containing protein n=1 Tax=Effrenium voratum TaxID=2562239 RepID=A0AA36N5I5_9DINO|nr:unnamed protein product [Effrenium voratum]CAJ1419379.1 unnamed protein product [Effrenium voratum]